MKTPVVKRPCPGCPFVDGPERVKLAQGRATEIVATADPFVCHATVDYGGGGADTHRAKTCAGWLLFREHAGYGPSQAVRIFERLGGVDVQGMLDACADVPVFRSLQELEDASDA